MMRMDGRWRAEYRTPMRRSFGTAVIGMYPLHLICSDNWREAGLDCRRIFILEFSMLRRFSEVVVGTT
jgi:hypothetical protein